VGLLSARKIKQAEISLTFVGTVRIRRLNREYLGRDRVTDVLAFDLSGGEEDSTGGRNSHSPLVGDIYVCVPRAKKQAADHGIPAWEELVRLAVHGVLHLLGYDHENETDSRRMNRLQENLVSGYRAGRQH
jgi:probable rRNA maturation factor